PGGGVLVRVAGAEGGERVQPSRRGALTREEDGAPIGPRVALQGEPELLDEREPPLVDVLVVGVPLGVAAERGAGHAQPGPALTGVGQLEPVAALDLQPALFGRLGDVLGVDEVDLLVEPAGLPAVPPPDLLGVAQ